MLQPQEGSVDTQRDNDVFGVVTRSLYDESLSP